MSAPVKREEVRDLLKSAFGPGDVGTMTGIFSRVTGTHCWRLSDVPEDKLQAVWDATKWVIAERASPIAPVNKRYTYDDVKEMILVVDKEAGRNAARRVLGKAAGCETLSNVTPDKFEAVIELAQKVRDAEHPDDVLGDYAPAHEVVAVRESGDGIATPAQVIVDGFGEVMSATAAAREDSDQRERLRKAMLVSISDVGLCMNDLGTILIQDLRGDTRAKRGGIAIGVRRAAWRIEHGSLDGFDIEETRRKRHVDIEPFIVLLRDILKHFDARTFADPVALEDEEIELIRQISDLLLKADKPKNMKG